MNKYPRYQRKERLNIKLTPAQTASIRKQFRDGASMTELSTDYGVSRTTIKYWTMTPDERKECNKKRKDRKHTYNPAAHRRFLDRKKELKNREILAYRNSINAIYKSRHLDEIRGRDRIAATKRREARKEPATKPLKQLQS